MASAKYQKLEQTPERTLHSVDLSESEEETEQDGRQKNEGQKSDVDSQTWGLKRISYVLAGCAINFFINAVQSLIMPYFPIVGVKKGVSKTVIGMVFSWPCLAGGIAALFTGKLIRVFGLKRCLIGGLTLAGLCQLVFGFGAVLSDKVSFVIFSLLSRTLAVVGAYIFFTSMLAFLGHEFQDNLAFVYGICQFFSGLGLCATPTLSGFLYRVGGYILPTLVIGFMLLATALSLLLMFWNVNFPEPSPNTVFQKTVISVLKNPVVLIAALSAFLCVSAIFGLEAMFAILGSQILHLNEQQIGLMYAAVWTSFLPSSMLIGYIIDKVQYFLSFIMSGFASVGFGLVVIGPAPILERILPVGTIWLTVVAEILVGVGQGVLYIPLLPYMYHSLRNKGEKTDVITDGIAAGIYTAANALGHFTGPLVAGILADQTDIRTAFTILGFVVLAHAGMLAIFGLSSYFKRSKAFSNSKQNL